MESVDQKRIGICSSIINDEFIHFCMFFRDNDDSFARGVLSNKSYERGQKRNLVSIKMCMTSWMIELSSTLCFVSFTFLHSFGLHNLHYPDCIIMNFIIPLAYLMNDEETKGIIAEENWYQGLRYMLGRYKPSGTT